MLCFLLTIAVIALLPLFARKVFPGPSPKREVGAVRKRYPSSKGEGKKPWAVITGASAGIGKEFAEQLAADGFNLVVVARRVDKMEEMCTEIRKKYKVDTKTLGFDLGKPGSAQELHKAVADLDVSLFINNAGYGDFQYFHDQNVELVEEMIQLNVTSVAVLTRLFLTDFIARGKAGVKSGMVITASLGAYMPGPCTALYVATKVFDSYLSWAIWKENKATNTNVDVLSLEPGATATEFSQVARGGTNPRRSTRYATASFVVTTALDDLIAGKPNSIATDFDYYCTFLPRILPRSLVAELMYKFFSPSLRSAPRQ